MKPEREPKEGRARQMEMKRNHAEKCRERRRRQVPEQTWQRARQALKDRGLRIFIIIFFNLGLSEEKGQLRKGEGRGNYSSYSVTTPEGENTGYTRSSVIPGAGAGAGAALRSLWFRFAAVPQPVGLGYRSPPSRPPGLPRSPYHSIFMTRLVNKTSELATHIYLCRSSSAKQRPAGAGWGGDWRGTN